MSEFLAHLERGNNKRQKGGTIFKKLKQLSTASSITINQSAFLAPLYVTVPSSPVPAQFYTSSERKKRPQLAGQQPGQGALAERWAPVPAGSLLLRFLMHRNTALGFRIAAAHWVAHTDASVSLLDWHRLFTSQYDVLSNLTFFRWCDQSIASHCYESPYWNLQLKVGPN